MSGNDKKKSKKTMWVILIILVLVIVYYLYNQKSENFIKDWNMGLENDTVRLTCNSTRRDGCFKENLTGTNGPNGLKTFVVSNTKTDIRVDREEDAFGIEFGANQPSTKQIIAQFKIDINKIPTANLGLFNLIVYETKYKVGNVNNPDIRFSHIAFLYIKKKIYLLQSNSDNSIYANFSDTRKSWPIIKNNRNKNTYNTFIVLSNPRYIKNIDLKAKTKNMVTIYNYFKITLMDNKPRDWNLKVI